jgi:hypothetical protein
VQLNVLFLDEDQLTAAGEFCVTDKIPAKVYTAKIATNIAPIINNPGKNFPCFMFQTPLCFIIYQAWTSQSTPLFPTLCKYAFYKGVISLFK